MGIEADECTLICSIRNICTRASCIKVELKSATLQKHILTQAFYILQTILLIRTLRRTNSGSSFVNKNIIIIRIAARLLPLSYLIEISLFA